MILGLAIECFLLAQSTQSSSPPAPDDARAMAHMLYYLLILIVVFMVGSYALMRASRRFRESVTAGSVAATPTPDIWSMHKLPRNDSDDPDRDAAGEGPAEPGPSGGGSDSDD